MGRLSVREVALITVFASLWIGAQVSLGPLVGRFSFGPISMHGVMNHLVGWYLMTVMAAYCGRFGRVSFLALIAAIGTRIIRASLIEGVLVGLGYALAGLLFDLLYFMPPVREEQDRGRRIYLLAVASATGVATLIPFLAFRFYLLGPLAFIVLRPSYGFSAAKNLVFSLLGTSLALSTLPMIKKSLRTPPRPIFRPRNL